jgi:hypothetical protein
MRFAKYTINRLPKKNFKISLGEKHDLSGLVFVRHIRDMSNITILDLGAPEYN